MNKTLILVESPTKAKTLDRFLKGNYDIQASMGHIRDLPKGKFGIDVEKNFKLQFVIPADKQKTVDVLCSKVKHADKVILATDPDREGEAIAHHLFDILKDVAKKSTSFDRIVFHEITESAIKHALDEPRKIDDNLVSAQTARRVLDRIVGYKLSPLLWKKIRRNLSAGRVQSVALRLIVEREKEIKNFKQEDYCKINALLINAKKKTVEFELIEINGEKIEISTKIDLYDGDYTYTKTILDKKKAEEVNDDLKKSSFKVLDIVQKETKRSPYPPLITSSLQQEASRRLNMPSRKTMSVAQKLYEEGFITYHRTDSFNLSGQFVNQARNFIKKEFGDKYLPEKPRFFQTKSKVAQEAHEAIRPTSVENKSEIVEREYGKVFARVYEIIYKRAIATQMNDAIFESTKVMVEASNGNKYLFEKNGSVLIFDGFLKILGNYEKEEFLPEFKKDEMLKLEDVKVIDNKTNPPPRYTEATLIGALEKNGIGRPSTYAPIISTIQHRNYTEKNEGRFVPTPVGVAVTEFLVKNFEDVDDIPFTAEMEDSLDKIANGEMDWKPMIKDFYSPFEAKVEKAEKEDRVQIPVEETDKKCPQCSNNLVIRTGKFGKFYACSKFPDCKYTESYVTEINQACPKCGGKIIVKKTRKGKSFYGCSNYPNCDFAAWKLKDIEKAKPAN